MAVCAVLVPPGRVNLTVPFPGRWGGGQTAEFDRIAGMISGQSRAS